MSSQRILAVALALECALFALLAERFATLANAFEVVRATAELGLVALAMLAVMKSGGIDLSVGSVMSLAAVVLGSSHAAGLPIAASAALALVAGAAGGALQGLLVAGGVPALLATLAGLALF